MENRYRVRSWASFARAGAWRWWRYMFLFWTTHGYFVGYGVLFRSGIKKKGILGKSILSITLGLFCWMSLDVIFLFFYFFQVFPYLNSILLVEKKSYRGEFPRHHLQAPTDLVLTFVSLEWRHLQGSQDDVKTHNAWIFWIWTWESTKMPWWCHDALISSWFHEVGGSKTHDLNSKPI